LISLIFIWWFSFRFALSPKFTLWFHLIPRFFRLHIFDFIIAAEIIWCHLLYHFSAEDIATCLRFRAELPHSLHYISHISGHISPLIYFIFASAFRFLAREEPTSLPHTILKYHVTTKLLPLHRCFCLALSRHMPPPPVSRHGYYY
jgi:hypothetical protein